MNLPDLLVATARNGEIEQLAYSLFTRGTTWSSATEQLQDYYLQQQDMLAAA